MTLHAPVQNLPKTEAPMRVLLVDDDSIQAHIFRLLLEVEGAMEFHHCEHAGDALEQALRLRPSVILQDLSMPGDHGFALLSRFRAHPETKHIPVVVFSGRDDARTKSVAFGLGASDYIVKTVEATELLARLSSHARSFEALRERDHAYNQLLESERQLWESNASLLEANRKLTAALADAKHLSGTLPMCSCCSRVRDDHNDWNEVATYLQNHTDLEVSHGLCEECLENRASEMGLDRTRAKAVTSRFRPNRGVA